MQRSIQRRRQQQKILSMNIDTNDIEIFYRSIHDHSPLHLRENQILVFTCDDNKPKLSNTSIWLCTTLNEVSKRIVFVGEKIFLFRLKMIFFNVFLSFKYLIMKD